jgi:hypothetical protein
LWCRYDVVVDVAPEVIWIPENGYRDLKIVVEIDSEIDAQRASEQELRQRHKSLGSMRIITDRGLQVINILIYSPSLLLLLVKVYLTLHGMIQDINKRVYAISSKCNTREKNLYQVLNSITLVNVV